MRERSGGSHPEGGREVEAGTELLALSTPPTGPQFSHYHSTMLFTLKENIRFSESYTAKLLFTLKQKKNAKLG